ncbi:hypothetical protein TNCT_452661 [Trichonephila clavata]|uniref:Uncharacterized protein n=1 Tax=Trichonephila clavata TaxID=2740835 RepID=A0A8X6JK33_TRICU|nr:hypothetical protein TNCT_452661 [Trichonephila clavata]
MTESVCSFGKLISGSSSSRLYSLCTGLTSSPVSVLTRATLTCPSFPGISSIILASVHRVRFFKLFSSTTTSPTVKGLDFRWC